MAVEIPDTEPTYGVHWRQYNPDSIIQFTNNNVKDQVLNSKYDSVKNNGNKNIIYENITQRFNNDFKTTVSAFSTVVKAESSFREIKDNLFLMRYSAQSILNQRIDNNVKEQLSKDFYNYKDNINNIYKNNKKNGVNLLEQLKDKGVTYRINSQNKEQISITLNNKENGINGFNTKGLGIDNLTIKNDKEAENAINKINKVIGFINKNEDKLNQIQGKINSLLNSLTNADNIIKDGLFIKDFNQAKKESGDIVDIILGNKNEASKIQANSRYENYLNLLKSSPDFSEQSQT